MSPYVYAVYWLQTVSSAERMLITCVMQQHARTYKLQLSGPSPTVYSTLYCDPYLMLTMHNELYLERSFCYLIQVFNQQTRNCSAYITFTIVAR